jgi:hypothetical protein
MVMPGQGRGGTETERFAEEFTGADEAGSGRAVGQHAISEQVTFCV